MDTKKIDLMRKAINSIINANAIENKEMGFTMTLKNCKYNDNSCTFQLECVDVVNGVVVNMEAVNWDKYATMFGMKKEWMNAEVTLNGNKYVITGINPKRRKYACVVKRVSDQKSYLFDPDAVIRAMTSNMPATEIPDDLMKKFFNLLMDMSPENLTCDGERSKMEVDSELEVLKTSWAMYEYTAKRKVTESEVWAWKAKQIGVTGERKTA